MSERGQLELFGDLPQHDAARADRMGAVEAARWGESAPAEWAEGGWSVEGGVWVRGDERLEVLIGVDEAGRGPLAGPVSVAALALSPAAFADGARPPWLELVDDSKKLTEKRRESLFEPIARSAEAFAIVHVQPDHIDAVNILQATFHGMAMAVEALLGREGSWEGRPEPIARQWEPGVDPLWYAEALEGDEVAANLRGARLITKKGEPKSGRLVVDGRDRIEVRGALATGLDQSPIKKGDTLSVHIAAASVLAKVSRDRLMVRADALWPGYGFARHKGYPTRAHKEALAERGACPIHRRTFSGVASS